MTRKLSLPKLGLLALVAAAVSASRAPAAAQTGAPTGLRLPAIFADRVVLQRGAVLPVWGWAAPGEAVRVTFRGTSRATRADAAGNWRVALPAQQAGGPFELTVSAGSA